MYPSLPGPFMKGSKMLFAISPLSTVAYRKTENRKWANTQWVKAPHYYRTKLTTAPLRRETHTFLLNLRQSESVSLPSIHSLASMRPRGVICACVHLWATSDAILFFGGVQSILKTCELWAFVSGKCASLPILWSRHTLGARILWVFKCPWRKPGWIPPLKWVRTQVCSSLLRLWRHHPLPSLPAPAPTPSERERETQKEHQS